MSNFNEWDELSEEEQEEMAKQAEVINKLMIGTFETELGKKCLDNLKRAYVDRPIYIQGMSLDQVAHRQGQCDVIKDIIQTVEGAKNGR